MNLKVRVVLGLLLACGASIAADGQVLTGTPAFNSFGGGPDVVNLGNLNVHWDIPIVDKTGRGQNFSYEMTYDSSLWYPVSTGSATMWEPVAGYGWGGSLLQSASTYIMYSVTTQQGTCGQTGNQSWESWTYNSFVYRDLQGTNHPLEGELVYISSPGGNYCPTNGWQESMPVSFSAEDNSGLTLTANCPANDNTLSLSLTNSSGTGIDVPIIANNESPQGAYTVTDRNGNEIGYNGSGQFTDTLGTTALSFSGGNPMTVSFTNPSGNQSSYTVAYTSYTLQTHFQCGTTGEYSQANTYLPTTITLPDGRSYEFVYEQTPSFSTGYTTGRLAQITLPTGGVITYAYPGSNDGVECIDGTAASLNRTTPDGEWQYSRSGSGSQWATTVTTPTYKNAQNQNEQDQTVISFLTNAGGPYTQFYEISRQMYSGLKTSLLQTNLTCYASASCSSTLGDSQTSIAGLITWRQQTVQMGGSTARAYGNQETFNNYGLMTQEIDYDVGQNGSFGNALRQTNTAYAALADGVNSMPSQVSVENGAGTSTYSKTVYTYDASGSITATTGTPQHESGVNAGNLTKLTQYVSGGSTLVSSYTYYDTGNVNVATDVNGAQTTYTYASTGCSNSLPTKVTSSVNSLSTAASWSCSGGVIVQTTDPNGNHTQYGYTDPNYWRVTSTTDWLGNITTQTYPSMSSNAGESAMPFNGNQSISDLLTVYDTLGRTQFQQTRQGPGATTFDTTETTYDALGRVSGTSIPYSASQGGTQQSFTGVSDYYDALGRITQVSDSGGGTTNYTWNQNDQIVADGPAPAGEGLKQRQYEYDGLGRLGSVCEVTSSLPGKGTCNQVNAQSGYWTQYEYDPAGNLLEVQQNAQNTQQTQIRMFSYDWLGRTISQLLPESGTTTYTYDSAPACPSPNSFPGDLVMIQDQEGDTTCNQYDGLHRLTKTTVISGPYSTASPIENYVYDGASGDGVTMQNVKGQLAEAYTCAGSCSSRLTATFFSYSASNGNLIAQEYERTPESNSEFYVAQDTYFPNGAVENLTSSYNGAAIPGMPSVTYNVDGEGRPLTAADGTNSLVTNVNYNAAELPAQVTVGNQATGSGSDVDSFLYDPNTYRPTQFEYSLNPSSNAFTITGQLNWNANWSLYQLGLTDTNDSSKSQTCTYSADDLERAASADCVNDGNTVWNQSFTYDPFGNITKTANPGQAYDAQYSYATNYVSPGGPEATYDQNGNQTENAADYIFSWNAYGQPVTLNGVSATYDALGRMVETASGGSYQDFVYRPSGAPLAQLYRAALNQAWLPLPGGGTAMYNNNGLNYIRHIDWLGSSRLATTWAHAIHAKEAYAPFGEPYNETSTTDRSFTGEDQTTVQGGSNAQGLYDFLFRRQDAASGRWLSPDPYNGSYDLTNPQSLNRYTYVTDNPLNFIDPTGLEGNCLPPANCSINDSPPPPSDSPPPLDPCDVYWYLCVDPMPVGYGPGGRAPNNRKCATAIMQPQYTSIFGEMGSQLKISPLFVMSTALQESGWNLTHVYGTNSSSHGQPLNNLFGMTNEGGNNIAYPSIQASVQAWIADWGSYLSGQPQTIQAYAAALNSNPQHMYNSNPAYPGQLAARYKQLVSATAACGTTF